MPTFTTSSSTSFAAQSSTPPVCPTPCYNPGLDWTYYNYEGYGVPYGDSQGWDPTWFETHTVPNTTGVTQSPLGIGSVGNYCGFGASGSESATFYGRSEHCNYFALEYTAFIYAYAAGNYTFTIEQGDDVVFLWLGNPACRGYTIDNAALRVASRGSAATVVYTATAGQFIPFRVHYGQVNYDYYFAVDITGPDGRVLASGNSNTSNYIVEMYPSTCSAFPSRSIGASGLTASATRASPSSTVAPRVVATTSPLASVPTPCLSYGVDYAVFQDSSIPPQATPIDPTKYKSLQPVNNGTEYKAVSVNDPCTSTTSTATFYTYTGTCNEIVLIWRGYLYAVTAGTYTFALPTNADDRMFAWVGPTAFSGWTFANKNMETSYSGVEVTASATTTFVAQAGTYIPYRVLLAQNGGLVFGSLKVTAPDGTVLMDPASPANVSDHFVRYTCESNAAPAFASWGRET
ncbi:unnamed protein product [Discula destructiva]